MWRYMASAVVISALLVCLFLVPATYDRPAANVGDQLELVCFANDGRTVYQVLVGRVEVESNGVPLYYYTPNGTRAAVAAGANCVIGDARKRAK